MKVILQNSRYYFLRFDKGEEVLAGLLDLAKQQNITAAVFSGIGACGELEIGFYNLSGKNYLKQTIREDLEIVSLQGNLAVSDGKPALHMHGSFGRHDLTTLSGHVFKIVVSVTCEIFLTKLEGELKRELDRDLNLNLLV